MNKKSEMWLVRNRGKKPSQEVVKEQQLNQRGAQELYTQNDKIFNVTKPKKIVKNVHTDFSLENRIFAQKLVKHSP